MLVRSARLGSFLSTLLVLVVLVPLYVCIPASEAQQEVGAANVNGCKLHENELSFMKRCYCKPGWVSSVPRPHLRCDKPLHEIGRCQCGTWTNDKHVEIYMSKDPKEHNTYLDTIEQFGGDDVQSHLRCYNLCRSTPEVGVPISHPGEWKDNLYWKQIGFYTKELKICSLNLRHSHMRQRLDEFTIRCVNRACERVCVFLLVRGAWNVLCVGILSYELSSSEMKGLPALYICIYIQNTHMHMHACSPPPSSLLPLLSSLLPNRDPTEMRTAIRTSPF
jgi:hypothetical protein